MMFQLLAEEPEGEQRAEAGGGRAGEDRERVDEILVEDTKHDVDDDDGEEQQAGPWSEEA